MGRPPKPDASRYTVRISRADYDTLADLGDGNFTRGIERAAARIREAEVQTSRLS
jgi:hypothetical protein